MVARSLVCLAVGLALSGCSTPCEKSANVQLTLRGDATLLGAATQLELVLTVGGSAVAMNPALISGPFEPDRTILLVPGNAPKTSSYELGLSAVLIGKTSTTSASTMVSAGANACNRASLTFASMSKDGGMAPSDGALDQSFAPDGSLAGDAAMIRDLQCMPTIADEDGDGISDPCDVCAANADDPPVDTDTDGVPDACDPDATVPDNEVKLFESFNAALTGWTGATTVGGGSLVIPDDGCVNLAERSTGVGGEVQLQTYVTPMAFDFADAPSFVEVGLFAAENGNGNKGIACLYEPTSMGDTQIVLAQGAVFTDPNIGAGGSRTQVGIMPTLSVNSTRRLRMTVHDGTVSCTFSAANGSSGITLSQAAAMNYTNLVPGLGTCFASAKFSSLFVVTDP